jgi:hypothetical protein
VAEFTISAGAFCETLPENFLSILVQMRKDWIYRLFA